MLPPSWRSKPPPGKVIPWIRHAELSLNCRFGVSGEIPGPSTLRGHVRCPHRTSGIYYERVPCTSWSWISAASPGGLSSKIVTAFGWTKRNTTCSNLMPDSSLTKCRECIATAPRSGKVLTPSRPLSSSKCVTETAPRSSVKKNGAAAETAPHYYWNRRSGY
jgi:hypothetical protein